MLPIIFTDPFCVGTIISQTGAFGENLGVLELSYSFDTDRLTVRYPFRTHIPIDSSIPCDPYFLKRIEEFKGSIATVTPYLLHQFDDLIYDKHLDDPSNLFHFEETEMSLATIACTGILHGLRSVAKNGSDPIQLYFIPPGMIRSTVPIVNNRAVLQFSDVFRLLAMGFDPEGKVGFPIVDFYLYKNELSLMIESLSILQTLISPQIGFAFSDSVFHTSQIGLPFINRLVLEIGGIPYQELPDLVHVATNSFLAEWLCRSEEVTFGMLSLMPKDHSGRHLKVNDLMVRAKAAGSLREFDLFSIYLRSL